MDQVKAIKTIKRKITDLGKMKIEAGKEALSCGINALRNNLIFPKATELYRIMTTKPQEQTSAVVPLLILVLVGGGGAFYWFKVRTGVPG